MENPLNVELKLQVLGAYSATAPYDCPKSKAIFEQGCRLIAEKGFENADIPDHLNALALLAGGDKKHHPTLAKYATKARNPCNPRTLGTGISPMRTSSSVNTHSPPARSRPSPN